MVPDDRVDWNIVERILESELRELVSWAIEGGAQALHRGHLTVPKSSLKSLENWRLDNDPVAAFVEQDYASAIEKNQPKKTWEPLGTMHSRFGAFAEQLNFAMMSRTKFKRRVEELGYRLQKTERGMAFPLVRKTDTERRASEVWSEATVLPGRQEALEERFDD